MLHNTDETMKIAAAGAESLNETYYLYRQKNMSATENTGYARPGKIRACITSSSWRRNRPSWLWEPEASLRESSPDGRIERCDNVKDVGLYIEKIDEMIKRKRNCLRKTGEIVCIVIISKNKNSC